MGKIEQRPGKVSFGRAFKDYWSGYVDFKGRTTRAGYWWMRLIINLFWLAVLGIMLAMFLGKLLTIIPLKDFSTSMELTAAQNKALGNWAISILVPVLIAGLVGLAMLLPSLALRVRRFRDAGLRGRGQLVLIAIYVVVNMFVSVMTYSQNTGGVNVSVTPGNTLSLISSLVMFILSVLPTGALATDKETGMAAFFFKNKKFYEDNDVNDNPTPYQTPDL